MLPIQLLDTTGWEEQEVEEETYDEDVYDDGYFDSKMVTWVYLCRRRI